MNFDSRPAQPALVLSLPPELLSLIISQTPYHARHALRLTHRTFLALIPSSALQTTLATHLATLYTTEHLGLPFPTWALALATHPPNSPSPPNPYVYPTPRSHRNKHLLPRSHTPRHNPIPPASTLSSTSPTLHPCSICLLALPPWHFSARQSASAALSGARRRYCIDCAIAEGIWPAGTVVAGAAVVCGGCGEFGLLKGRGDRPGKKEEKERQDERAVDGDGGRRGDGGSGSGGREQDPVERRQEQAKRNRRMGSPSERMCGECVEAAMRDDHMRRAETGRDGEGAEGADEDDEEGRHAIAESTRSGRCQRCWAINHTERKAEQEIGGRPLCGTCWGLVSDGSIGG